LAKKKKFSTIKKTEFVLNDARITGTGTEKEQV